NRCRGNLLMRSRWEISLPGERARLNRKSKFQIRNLHETARSLRGGTISPSLFVLHRRIRLDLVHLRRKRQHLDLSRPTHLPDVDPAILSYPGPADPCYFAPGRPAPGAPLQPGPDVALERNRFDAHCRGKLASDSCAVVGHRFAHDGGKHSAELFPGAPRRIRAQTAPRRSGFTPPAARYDRADFSEPDR